MYYLYVYIASFSLSLYLSICLFLSGPAGSRRVPACSTPGGAPPFLRDAAAASSAQATLLPGASVGESAGVCDSHSASAATGGAVQPSTGQ